MSLHFLRELSSDSFLKILLKSILLTDLKVKAYEVVDATSEKNVFKSGNNLTSSFFQFKYYYLGIASSGFDTNPLGIVEGL